MYGWTLVIHSWLRWAILLAGAVAIVRAIGGLSGKRPWGRGDDLAATLFVRSLHLQFAVGLLLYFGVSPLTRQAMRDFGAAMADGTMRFFAVEHVFGMLVAVALASIGKIRVGKTLDPVRRHRVALIFFGLAFLLLLAAIPWPFAPYGRPLFRL